jgi:hypothetical protein
MDLLAGLCVDLLDGTTSAGRLGAETTRLTYRAGSGGFCQGICFMYCIVQMHCQ